MIKILQLLFSCFFGAGLFLILADRLKIPALATRKAVISAINREKKQSKSFSILIFDIAAKLSKYIKLDEYKKRRMAAALKSANISLDPETYIAKAIVKTALILTLIVPCLFILPILAPVVVVLAAMVFFKEYNSAGELVRSKREAIERELPRFVNTITQELKASRDILSILETYQKHTGDAFKAELEVTVADMKSGSQETALTRFESRMGSSQLSEVIRGLISVMRGDNGIVHFQMLSHDLKQLEVQKLKLIAIKRPDKIKKYSFAMLGCFLLMYLIIIGVEILSAFGKLF